MEGLEDSWRATARALPDGWDLSLRCASAGLGVDERSDRWRAVAERPDGSTLEGNGDDPIAALTDLRRALSER